MGKPQILSVVQFICLLAIATVWAEDVFKTEFGEKFGVEMRRYNAELLKSNLENLKEFYQTAMDDFGLKEQDVRGFKTRLESVDEMKNRIGDTVTPELVKRTTSFNKLVMFELFMFRGSSQIAKDSVIAAAFDAAMRKCAAGETENVRQFVLKLAAKWKELYPTIPQNELEKHAEYKEINDSIENLEILYSTPTQLSEVLERTVEFVKTITKVSTFFNYTEWNAILSKKKHISI